MNLQPTTPPEVRSQREADLKIVVVSIFVALVDYNKLLDESM